MGTIITVHGTGATGLAEGGSWWQKGSLFEQHIRTLIGAKDSELLFEPFIWDGYNSENSRFKAGRRLLRRLLQLEETGENYCLVGHSHGGSLISHALLLAAYEKHALPNLRQWISVGTPFIETRRHLLLFSRLDDLGGAAYLIFAYLLIAYVSFLISIVVSGADNPFVDFIFVGAGCVVLLTIYFLLHLLQPEKLRLVKWSPASELRDMNSVKWLSLRHRDDEAIQSLRLAKDVRLSPFDKAFAVPTISFAALLMLPPLMYFLSLHVDYGRLATDISAWSPYTPSPEVAISEFERFARRSLALIAYPSHYFFNILGYFGVAPTRQAWFDGPILACVLVVGVVIAFSILWLLALGFRLLIIVIGAYFSQGLSWILNNVTQQQLRKLSFGSDTLGETAIAAIEQPRWLTTRNGALPAILAKEISEYSDAAAAASIGKLRATLAILVLGKQESNVGDAITKYLTWHELIHTSYFHVSRFRKLVAYSISRLDGFGATPDFENDPDYSIVAEWYAELMLPSQAQ